MKKYNLIIVVLLLIVGSMQAQNTLYFLKATPVEDPYLYSNEIPATLLKYNKDSLKFNIVVGLSTYNNRINDIRYYYDNNQIIITKETKKLEKNFYIVNTEHFDSLIYKPINCPESYDYLTYRLLSINNIPNICLECINTKFEKYSHLKGYDLDNLSEKEFGDNDYKYLILSGANLYRIFSQDDFQDIYTEATNGNMRIPVVRDISERPIFPLILPDSLQLKKITGLLILINNKNQFVLELISTEFSANKIGSTTLIIYNYNKKKWDKQQIKGNYPSINSYGNWLAGMVCDYTGKSYNTNRISPGKNIRKKLNSKNPFNV